jgi:hypothetical protein
MIFRSRLERKFTKFLGIFAEVWIIFQSVSACGVACRHVGRFHADGVERDWDWLPGLIKFTAYKQDGIDGSFQKASAHAEPPAS